jgi:hypothetical protein
MQELIEPLEPDRHPSLPVDLPWTRPRGPIAARCSWLIVCNRLDTIDLDLTMSPLKVRSDGDTAGGVSCWVRRQQATTTSGSSRS